MPESSCGGKGLSSLSYSLGTPQQGQNQPLNQEHPKGTPEPCGGPVPPQPWLPWPLTSSVSSGLCPGRLSAGRSSAVPGRRRLEPARQSRQSQALSMLPVPDASLDAQGCAGHSWLYNPPHPLSPPLQPPRVTGVGKHPLTQMGSGCPVGACAPPNFDVVIKHGWGGGHTHVPGRCIPRDTRASRMYVSATSSRSSPRAGGRRGPPPPPGLSPPGEAEATLPIP